MGVIFKNNVMYGAGDIEISPVCYSEEEREIGCWTDGKPLYQTTIHTGALTKDGNWHSIAHNIPNIDKIILCTGTVYAIDNTAYPMPNYRPTYNIGICLDATTTNIEYIQNWLDTSPDSYVTLQYTKTTDTPGSGTWTPSGVPAVHYSTNEQIVGTWIDGKPIYEKTINVGSLSTGDNNVAHGITDLDFVVSTTGKAKRGNSPITIPQVSVWSMNWNATIYDFNSTSFNVGVGSSYTGIYALTDCYITIQYTKTTS